MWSPPECVDMTAVGAALMRARHLLVDGEPKVFNDEFAIRLVGAPRTSSEGPMTGVPLATGNTATTAAWVLRSRMQKTVLKPLAGAGYVILGAGLDSFALRHAATPSELAVFEVDAPRTQDRKRRRLAELGLELPGNLRFAPCDFEMLEVGKRISAAAGVNFATFFAPDEMAGVLRDAGFAETEDTFRRSGRNQRTSKVALTACAHRMPSC